MGSQCSNDAIPYAAHGPTNADVFYQYNRSLEWCQTRWTSPTAAQPSSQGDEKRGGQAVTAFAVHCSRDSDEIQKQGEKSSIKNLSSAVRALGDAKQDLLEAENARAQMLTQWKHFIQQSLAKWREYTASFQASENAHQQGVQAARLVVRRAQKAFDAASKREQAGKDGALTISDSETEIADDVMEDPHGDGVQRVQDGMNSIVASLEELSSSADQLEQRIKRPRTSEGDAGTAPAPPFGKAGAA